MTAGTQLEANQSVLKLDWKVAGVALLVLGLAGGALLMLLPPPPRILVVQEQYNWGVLPPGVATHRFDVKNAGGKDLIIQGFTFSCDCATARTSGPIEPGRLGTVDVTVDSSERLGELGIDVEVLSNDPDMPRRKLRLSGSIEPLVQVGAERPTLEARIGERARTEVKLWPQVRLNARVKSARARGGLVEARLEGVGADEVTLVLEAQIEQRGVRKEWIDLDVTSDRGDLKQSLVVVVREQRHCRVSPAQLLFAPEGSASETRQVLLEFPEAPQTRLQEVSIVDGDGCFEVRFERVESTPPGWRVDVTLTKTPAAALHRAKLRIGTDHADAPVIEVPLFYRRK